MPIIFQSQPLEFDRLQTIQGVLLQSDQRRNAVLMVPYRAGRCPIVPLRHPSRFTWRANDGVIEQIQLTEALNLRAKQIAQNHGLTVADDKAVFCSTSLEDGTMLTDELLCQWVLHH